MNRWWKNKTCPKKRSIWVIWACWQQMSAEGVGWQEKDKHRGKTVGKGGCCLVGFFFFIFMWQISARKVFFFFFFWAHLPLVGVGLMKWHPTHVVQCVKLKQLALPHGGICLSVRINPHSSRAHLHSSHIRFAPSAQRNQFLSTHVCFINTKWHMVLFRSLYLLAGGNGLGLIGLPFWQNF